MKRLLAAMLLLLLCLSANAFADDDITATAIEPAAKGLRISELMASNTETLEDSFGNTAD